MLYEDRVKSLVAHDEPLTPGILYVGVATLTGSVLARNRLFWRLTLPPALFILSLNHFLPRTSHNVSEYLGSLEEAHFPTLAEKHAIARAHSAMTWDRVKDATQNGRETFSDGVASAVGKVEEATGLKLRETLGWQQGVEAEAKEVVALFFVALECEGGEVCIKRVDLSVRERTQYSQGRTMVLQVSLDCNLFVLIETIETRSSPFLASKQVLAS